MWSQSASLGEFFNSGMFGFWRFTNPLRFCMYNSALSNLFLSFLHLLSPLAVALHLPENWSLSGQKMYPSESLDYKQHTSSITTGKIMTTWFTILRRGRALFYERVDMGRYPFKESVIMVFKVLAFMTYGWVLANHFTDFLYLPREN